ncbi:tetratricopeptide (TPR) repeat protein [Lewinella marina]|uniref:Tetratricopeptide repeat protein n=1 Tax=Neolewinella marina TaxID=438751 RepID=A0A2G0CFK6_9BACT|nr:tetratricopeptide repeat protein [Neolewinella marina]NJB85554.1 tetratricopeptide (TPR) repeat protein [Neolewinella marina]PHK98759.1 hypothetical protein CGL56_09860 [Neolewinella marina]
MRNSTILLNSLAFLILLALGCSEGADHQQQARAQEPEIPALLPRPAALQATAEWDQTQSGYSQMAAQLRLDNPNAIEPRINLAKIFINEARVTGEHGHYYPAALAMLDEALELNHQGPRDPNLEFDALSTKSGVLLSQHEFAEALTVANKAVSLNPYNAQVYGAIADANVELGDYEAAVRAADKMNEIRPDLRSYSRASYLREIHGDIDGAIDAMNRAVRAGAPGYESTAWARLTLGQLYHRYGQPDKAAAEYAALLRERPNYPFALAAQAELAQDAGDDARAEQLLIQARDIIPEVGYYMDLAKLYRKQGRTDELESMEQDILEMLEDDVSSGHNMDLEYATLYQDVFPDYDKALEYLLEEHNRRPANIDVNRELARLYVARGENDKALDHLTKAERTNSAHPDLAAIRQATGTATK